MTPSAAPAAAQVDAWKPPTMVRISPTNPLVPGRPTLAIENSMNSAGINRHAVHKAAVESDLARVHPVIDHADAEEERA